MLCSLINKNLVLLQFYSFEFGLPQLLTRKNYLMVDVNPHPHPPPPKRQREGLGVHQNCLNKF